MEGSTESGGKISETNGAKFWTKQKIKRNGPKKQKWNGKTISEVLFYRECACLNGCDLVQDGFRLWLYCDFCDTV